MAGVDLKEIMKTLLLLLVIAACQPEISVPTKHLSVAATADCGSSVYESKNQSKFTTVNLDDGSLMYVLTRSDYPESQWTYPVCLDRQKKKT